VTPDRSSALNQAPACAARSEQAEVAIGRGERIPFEPGLGDENFALESGCPGGGADLVSGLDGEQRLVAVDDIERGESVREVRGQPVGANLHTAV
jgi:hypothetical protein